MNYELILWLIGLMLFAYWFNYIIGSPLSDKPEDVDAKAILFDFPHFLATQRLKKNNLYKQAVRRRIEELNFGSDPATKVGLKFDLKKDEFLKGREFFTWERSLLCPICLHFWLTIIFGVFCLSFDLLNARADFLLACFTYLSTHLIIRKIA